MTHIVSAMLDAGRQSCEGMRAEICGVRYVPYGISFYFRDRAYTAELKGRNADLVLGGGDAADAAVALRTLLDGDAKPSGKEIMRHADKVWHGIVVPHDGEPCWICGAKAQEAHRSFAS